MEHGLVHIQTGHLSIPTTVHWNCVPFPRLTSLTFLWVYFLCIYVSSSNESLQTLYGNAALAGIFGIYAAFHLLVGIRFKTWGYMIVSN